MEMHQIRYFLATAEMLNFTRAAEKCNVAQPSLTRAIKLLEDELGGPLFHRERANTHLSELGKMVRPHLEQVFAGAQATKHLAQDFTKLKRTTLRFGVMCTIAPSHVIGLISDLQTKYEGIEIDIVDADARKLEERLLSGDLEVAMYANPANEHDERLHYLSLFREQFVVALPAGHPLAARNGVRPADLNGIEYTNRVHCEFNGVAGPIWRSSGLDYKVACRSDRDDWVLAMVERGLGFTFLPESSLQRHPGVVARPLVEPEFWREVCLVTVRGRPHSPAVGALVRESMRAQWFGKPALAVSNRASTEL
jgi:LysR family transcriptional regulator, hydrogen peroxide-inducible genes activator